MRLVVAARAAASLLLLVGGPVVAATQETIKLATLAPEGSTWMQVLEEYDAALRADTGGRLQLVPFSGGVAGAEPDVLRKIRFGQLDGAGLTGLGLGIIAPVERVLEGPYVFHGYAQVDAIHAAAQATVEAALAEAGYTVLGWAEVGFVYLFTRQPVSSIAELRRLRVWAWAGDPVADATFAAWGVSPVRLPLADVFTSLQTGGLDGIYAAPLGLIALQWHTHMRYMLDLPLGIASGALVLTNRRLDGLAPELREPLLHNGRVYMDRLRQRTREDGEAAIRTLRNRGIEILTVGDGERRQFERAAAVARRSMAPLLYPATLLDLVERAAFAAP